MSDIIVALDVDSIETAGSLVARLKHRAAGFKVGLELFTRYGPDAVRLVTRAGGRVFLDLKFHDIPHTVARSVEAAAGLGVWMMTLHAEGGREMMAAGAASSREAAVRQGLQAPLLLGVTVLTSLSDSAGTADEVLDLARLAKQSGLDGAVCSGEEAGPVRGNLGDGFLIVTPGIRLQKDSTGDQKRVASPEAARRAGANFLVVGRPIVEASDPLRALESYLPGA